MSGTLTVEENVDKCTEVQAGGHVPRPAESNGQMCIDLRRCKAWALCPSYFRKARIIPVSQGKRPVSCAVSHARRSYFSKFLQCRPSCSSRASASFGPQVPAA